MNKKSNALLPIMMKEKTKNDNVQSQRIINKEWDKNNI